MADKKKAIDDKKEGNKVLTMLIVIMIVIIWLALFGFLIKIDIGGFGSGVLSPILKDVPVVNMILPNESNVPTTTNQDFKYKSLSEAVAKIKQLQKVVDTMNKQADTDKAKITDLQAEVARLKVFEDNQKAFEERVAEFDKNVVFNDKAPTIEEYKKYYEAIDPTNAANLYQQVIQQLQYSQAIKDKANIYKSMDPKAAATILETMTADVESVAQILMSMKPKESAAILAEMDSVAAAKVTKMMLDLDEEKLSQ
jgi:Uncharacterized conserved protein